ncbi:MAG TPA: Uma2 family endonuclease [Terracidiphilus sp.]|nr:Uma2 family endonuclease [Terracidiphilus sp.]
MAAATQPTYVPLEVYLKSSYEPDAEYVDGVIEERPMGENEHSAWQHALDVWFGQHEKEWGIRVRPELRVQVANHRFRVPDLALLDRSLPTERFATHPPIAVFEILSPEDSLNRMMTKLADYERMGIKTILVLDPNGRHFRYLDGKLEPLPPEPFDLPSSACRFDLSAIEKLLD